MASFRITPLAPCWKIFPNYSVIFIWTLPLSLFSSKALFSKKITHQNISWCCNLLPVVLPEVYWLYPYSLESPDLGGLSIGSLRVVEAWFLSACSALLLHRWRNRGSIHFFSTTCSPLESVLDITTSRNIISTNIYITPITMLPFEVYFWSVH